MPGEKVCKLLLPLRSPAGPLGNIYQSSVSQKGDVAAMNICKLSFNLTSCLP